MFADLAAVLDIGVLAPDLPGHGAAPVVHDWPSTVDQVVERLEPAGRLPLMGYSQGGRVALGVAAARPDLVRHLVLVSTSPGIPDDADRATRRARDSKLAAHIERVGTERFVAEWVSLTMFQGMARRDDDWRERDLELRRTNGAVGLAAALRSYGTGVMPYLMDDLANLDCPVTVVVGSDDEPYRERSFDMARAASATLHVVGGAGHALVAEAPYELANIVREVL